MKYRLVYRKTQGPITKNNPSTKYEYTNQIYKDGQWEYYNRYQGKFGATPVIWYATIEWAQENAPKICEIEETVEIK